MNVTWPHPSLKRDWETGLYHQGCTEPWTVQLIEAIVSAKQAKCVIETGGFIGTTSAWLGLALEKYGGDLTVLESNPAHCRRINQRITQLGLTNVTVCETDALSGINDLKEGTVDVAFIDDDHTAAHVELEIKALLPKMNTRGVILGHDVHGPFGLDVVFRRYGGISLTLPVIHVAGGLGIIQT